MRGIVGTHNLCLRDELEDRADRAAVDNLNRNVQRKVRPRIFEVGELVLIEQYKDIRSGHKLRGRGRGPWRITNVMSDAVELADSFTGRPLLDDVTKMPDRINVDRLLRFAGSVDQLELLDMEDQLTLHNARAGGYIAFVNGGQVVVLKILEVKEEEYLTGNPVQVPIEERYGAASRRPWKLDEEQQVTVLWGDVLCLVDLDETGCLSLSSLDRLRRLGLEVAGGPQTH